MSFVSVGKSVSHFNDDIFSLSMYFLPPVHFLSGTLSGSLVEALSGLLDLVDCVVIFAEPSLFFFLKRDCCLSFLILALGLAVAICGVFFF